jgi:putative PIN family toxin of toxin-antitoxin system
MTFAAIIDTNVVVAGLITSMAVSPVARILDGMIEARFPCVISELLLHEYRRVLLRPKIVKLHGLTATDVDGLLLEIAHHAIVLTTVPAPPAPDPGDQHLWALLAARPDLILVTGDKRLVTHACMRGRVCSPGDFLTRID